MMKRLLKYIAIIPVGLVLLFSCNKDQLGETYTPSSEDGLYSFGATGTADMLYSAVNSTYSIDVYRADASGAATVGLSNRQSYNVTEKTSEGEDTVVTVICDVLDIPSSVSFADGETVASFNIGYKADAMEVGIDYSITISLEDGATLDGNSASISYTASLDYSWESLGTGQFYDSFIYAVLNDAGTAITDPQIQEVEIQKAIGFDRWRIAAPYANTEAIQNAWPGLAVSENKTAYWVFYLLSDGIHLNYGSTFIYTGLENGSYGTVAHVQPANLGLAYLDVMYHEDAGIFALNPAPYCPDGGIWWGQSFPVYVALPGVDLEAVLGTSRFPDL